MSALVNVSPSCVKATIEAIATTGNSGWEGAVFWLGPASTLRVQRVVIPGGEGVVFGPKSIRISTKWMDQLAEICEESGQVVLAGFHSHPSAAFHSEVDSEGFLHAPDFVSIVLPYYGTTTLAAADAEWAVYVGLEGGNWRSANWSSVVSLDPALCFSIQTLSVKGE